MKLLHSLYDVQETCSLGQGFCTTIVLNSNHSIYEAHFPGFPVTPGVVLLNIVHELLEQHSATKFSLVLIPDCKFLKVLNPMETNLLTIEGELQQKQELYQLKAMGRSGGETYFKCIALYRPVF